MIPRNSSYLYKDRSADVRQVGGELGARYVLDGSIRIAGSTLRISCVLIDATSGKQIWAERYDGAMEDVFDLQDKITSSIVATIGSKVLRAEITRAQKKPTDNLSAYDLYLRALAAISPSRTESSVNQAVELLQRAIAADQLFSSAYGSWPALIAFAWAMDGVRSKRRRHMDLPQRRRQSSWAKTILSLCTWEVTGLPI